MTKQVISYPDLLQKIVDEKDRFRETSMKMNKRDRKLFRRSINQMVEQFNKGIKVIKCSKI